MTTTAGVAMETVQVTTIMAPTTPDAMTTADQAMAESDVTHVSPVMNDVTTGTTLRTTTIDAEMQDWYAMCMDSFQQLDSDVGMRYVWAPRITGHTAWQ